MELVTAKMSLRKGTYEILVLTTVVYANVRFASLVEDLEGEVLHIGLNLGIIEFTSH